MPNQEAMLLERYARSGDAEAFSEIVRQYAGIVYGTCQRILGDRELAADATQETFFQLVKHAGQIRESLVCWLHRVATHKAIDRIRHDSNRRRREKEYCAGKLQQADQWQEVAPFVDEAIDELDEPLRRILTNHFLHGQTMNLIAEAEQVSQATISRRVETALDQLRRSLERRGILVAGVGLGTMLAQSFVEAAPAAVLEELGKMAIVGVSAAVSGSGAAAAVSAEAATVSVSAAGTATGVGMASKLVVAVIVAALGTAGYVVYQNHTGTGNDATTVSSSASDTAPMRSSNSTADASGVSSSPTLPQDEDFENWLESSSTETLATNDATAPVTPPSASQAPQNGYYFGGVATASGGMGFGGIGPRSTMKSFNTPDETVTSFVTMLEHGLFDQLPECFVEGAEDANRLQQTIQNPKNPQETEVKQCLESIGSPIEVTRQVQGSKGLEVTWLCTVKKPFTLGGEQGLSFKSDDRFEFHATLVQVGSEWKISGI